MEFLKFTKTELRPGNWIYQIAQKYLLILQHICLFSSGIISSKVLLINYLLAFFHLYCVFRWNRIRWVNMKDPKPWFRLYNSFSPDGILLLGPSQDARLKADTDFYFKTSICFFQIFILELT